MTEPLTDDLDLPSGGANRLIRELIAEADVAFATGDAERWAACFTEDAQLLLLHREALIGRPAILAHWRITSARFDTSAWEPAIELVEVSGEMAHAYTTYTERLLDRTDGSRTLVRGRLSYWFRREEKAGWHISLLMNSHSHPMEPIP